MPQYSFVPGQHVPAGLNEMFGTCTYTAVLRGCSPDFSELLLACTRPLIKSLSAATLSTRRSRQHTDRQILPSYTTLPLAHNSNVAAQIGSTREKSFYLRPGYDADAYAVCCYPKKNGFQTSFTVMLHFLFIHHGYLLCMFEQAVRH